MGGLSVTDVETRHTDHSWRNGVTLIGRLGRAEFTLVFRVNAYNRKKVEKSIQMSQLVSIERAVRPGYQYQCLVAVSGAVRHAQRPAHFHPHPDRQRQRLWPPAAARRSSATGTASPANPPLLSLCTDAGCVPAPSQRDEV